MIRIIIFYLRNKIFVSILDFRCGLINQDITMTLGKTTKELEDTQIFEGGLGNFLDSHHMVECLVEEKQYSKK